MITLVHQLERENLSHIRAYLVHQLERENWSTRAIHGYYLYIIAREYTTVSNSGLCTRGHNTIGCYCTLQNVLETKVEDVRNTPPLYKQFLLFLVILIPPHHVRKSQICLVGVKVYDCSYTWYKQFSVILNFEGEIKEKSYIFKKAYIHVFQLICTFCKSAQRDLSRLPNGHVT